MSVQCSQCSGDLQSVLEPKENGSSGHTVASVLNNRNSEDNGNRTGLSTITCNCHASLISSITRKCDRREEILLKLNADGAQYSLSFKPTVKTSYKQRCMSFRIFQVATSNILGHRIRLGTWSITAPLRVSLLPDSDKLVWGVILCDHC